MPQAKYKRVLLKLSGEALMGNNEYGIDGATLKVVTQQIKGVVDMGVRLLGVASQSLSG